MLRTSRVVRWTRGGTRWVSDLGKVQDCLRIRTCNSGVSAAGRNPPSRTNVSPHASAHAPTHSMSDTTNCAFSFAVMTNRAVDFPLSD